MENSFIIEFLLACTLMGLGIGADVTIATMLRGAQLNSVNKACFWLVGVTLTHTLFPMIGYLLTYFSIQSLPFLTPAVGLLAFSLIAYFLWTEFLNLKAQKKASGCETFYENSSQSALSFALILAVSWDALWSGPAKSAQVMGWSEGYIFSSFIFVGFVVALCALAGLYVSKKLSPLKLASGKYLVLGQWLQYSVIGYFALLALLRYTLSLEIEAWQVLLISCLLVATVIFPVPNFFTKPWAYLLRHHAPQKF